MHGMFSTYIHTYIHTYLCKILLYPTTTDDSIKAKTFYLTLKLIQWIMYMANQLLK